MLALLNVFNAKFYPEEDAISLREYNFDKVSSLFSPF